MPRGARGDGRPVQRGRRAGRGSGARTRLHGVRPLRRRPRSRGRGAVLRSPGASGVPRDEGRSAHRRARPRARSRPAHPAPLRGGERRREPARPRLPRAGGTLGPALVFGARAVAAPPRRTHERPRADRGDAARRRPRPRRAAVAGEHRRPFPRPAADDGRAARGRVPGRPRAARARVRRGERVGIVAPNCVDYHAALFGGALLGVEVVTGTRGSARPSSPTSSRTPRSPRC